MCASSSQQQQASSAASLSNLPKLLQKKNGVKSCFTHYNKLVQHLVNLSGKKLEMQQKEVEKYSTILNSAFSLSTGSMPKAIQQEIMDEVCETKFFYYSFIAFKCLPFETRKHVSTLYIIRMSWNSSEFDKTPALANHLTEPLNVIITQIIEEDNENIVMHLHNILKSCFQYYSTCKVVAESSLFFGITKNFYNQSFMMKSNAFSCMVEFLSRDHDFIPNWTIKYLPKLKTIISNLITDAEFIDQMQLLKLLRTVMANNSTFREELKKDMQIYKQLIWIFSKKKKDKISEGTLHLIKLYFDSPEALYYLKRNYDSHILVAIENNLEKSEADLYIKTLQNSFKKHSKCIKAFEASID
ncbi:MAG: hypothetical protein MHMPM18_003114 [Marteilia pararefringens]